MTAYSIIDSVSLAATSTPASYTPGGADSNDQNPPLPHLVRVYGNVALNVSTSGVATGDSMPVSPGYDGVLLSVPPGVEVSVVKQSGASDGLVWLSTVKRV